MTGEDRAAADRDRMKELEEERVRQRLVAVERQSEKQSSTQRLLGIGLLIALVLSAVAAFTPHLLAVGGDDVDLGNVSAESFILTDQDGVVRGRWTVDDGGNSRIAVLDRQGRTRLSLSVLSGGSPGMSFSNANGTSRAGLALLPDESVQLVFADGSGQPRTLVGLSRADEGYLMFADPAGEPQINIGPDGSGAPAIVLPEEGTAEETGEGGS
ncbi:MAG: hypothetical protein KJN92_13345 [Gemmatimonadetes bacterium]|nr:hypothetical protein [Gemmatimonadota bacterium]